ncbi:hypothetical protein GCM10010390_90440 [Streptomyces mordarskii]|uniref:Uncharacterized protein n=1 Tax=Streptomyces mordarskii TaxID=1226758 RepID=A0ABP3PQZ9_9ACTN
MGREREPHPVNDVNGPVAREVVVRECHASCFHAAGRPAGVREHEEFLSVRGLLLGQALT